MLDYAVVSLSGTFLRVDRVPAKGAVEVFPSRDVIIGGQAIMLGSVRVPLDVDGRFSVVLPASDDPVLGDPITYLVRASMHHATWVGRDVVLPAAAGAVDLANIPSSQVVEYPSRGEWDALVGATMAEVLADAERAEQAAITATSAADAVAVDAATASAAATTAVGARDGAAVSATAAAGSAAAAATSATAAAGAADTAATDAASAVGAAVDAGLSATTASAAAVDAAGAASVAESARHGADAASVVAVQAKDTATLAATSATDASASAGVSMGLAVVAKDGAETARDTAEDYRDETEQRYVLLGDVTGSLDLATAIGGAPAGLDMRLTGDVTLTLPSLGDRVLTCSIYARQDATGGRTLTITGALASWAVPITLTQTANAHDLIHLIHYGPRGWVQLFGAQNMGIPAGGGV